jgi:hypothetical protein
MHDRFVICSAISITYWFTNIYENFQYGIRFIESADEHQHTTVTFDQKSIRKPSLRSQQDM